MKMLSIILKYLVVNIKIKVEDYAMNYINFDPTKKIDVVPVGRVAIDFNPNELHRPLSEVTTFTKYLGGSPANIAVGLARLNKQVGFIGKVSDDQFGIFVKDYFKNEGIDVSNISVTKNGEVLGLTFTEILSPTQSQILMYRNGVADLQLSTEDISEEYIKNSKILLISGTALAASPSREACFLAIEYAKRHGTMVIFDIDYRSYTWKSKAEIAVYYSLVGKMSDIIIGSREEFDLTEMLDDTNTVKDFEIADKYLNYGNKIVIIKHGKKGSIAYCEGENAYKVDSFSVQLLKSFGGGDAYASAFIYGILEEWDIERALEFGTASAAMVVSSHSCSGAMPKVEDIKEFIESKNEKVITKVDWRTIV